MNLDYWAFELKLAHEWTIARSQGRSAYEVVFLRLTSPEGVSGLGEAAPSTRYDETPESVLAFYKGIDPRRLLFDDIPGSMEYLDGFPGQYAAKCGLNIALLDGAARTAGKPLYDWLGLGFTEGRHLTSFSIGIDSPDKVRQKAAEAAAYPILKLKVGGRDDRENLAALREAAPGKSVRVDANEGWRTKEEALRNIEWLAGDGHVEFVEQPMPAGTDPRELRWLRERSPLPLFGDESYLRAGDVGLCAECYHGVNVKLTKTGGITAAFNALRAARTTGLKTMIGCMIESSLLITAAAHLAELTDHLDIDGNLLITNDPFCGVKTRKGRLSFEGVPEPFGLRVGQRP